MGAGPQGRVYQPLAAQMRQRGVQAVEREGWRGRSRAFQREHTGTVHGMGLSGERAEVFPAFRGDGHRQGRRAPRR